MSRVKRGVITKKRHKKILSQTKGYKWRRKSVIKLAKEALLHAGRHMYRGRKEKKRVNRRLWQIKINAASRESSLSYNKLISGLKKKGVKLDRKILADIGANHPEVFKKIVELVR
ncbi:MAG: 50S ribosomal protein L20 [Parcubacteria group bacterium]|nr:50S ribosomal protein L20 [Parcubacteria group bacterium]